MSLMKYPSQESQNARIKKKALFGESNRKYHNFWAGVNYDVSNVKRNYSNILHCHRLFDASNDYNSRLINRDRCSLQNLH